MPKIPAYPSLTTPSNNDQLIIEDSVASSTKQITRANFLSGTPLPADTVDTQAIDDLAVTTAKIADGAVTPPKAAAGFVVQVVNTTSGAVSSGSTVIPWDDTIPQITEGDQYMTVAITPKSTTNILVIEIVASLATNGSAKMICGALFQDATANALAAIATLASATGANTTVVLTHTMVAGTTSATTLRFRAGGESAGTITFNGISGARKFGGVTASSIVITEYKA